jgi:hypothetical protein
VAVLLIAIGAGFAALTGRAPQTTIASSLFIGGGVLVVWNGLAGGGARGRRADLLARGGVGRAIPTAMPFEWVVVGFLLIGAGVVSLII